MESFEFAKKAVDVMICGKPYIVRTDPRIRGLLMTYATDTLDAKSAAKTEADKQQLEVEGGLSALAALLGADAVSEIFHFEPISPTDIASLLHFCQQALKD